MRIIQHTFYEELCNKYTGIFLPLLKELEEIKKELSKALSECNGDIDKHPKKEDLYHLDFRKVNIYEETDEYAFLTIITASFWIESFIYDFGAKNLGDTYTKNYLSKLDVKSKWVVIPKLVLSEELDRGTHEFKVLCNIIKIRNKFAHFKSRKIKPIDKDYKLLLDFEKEIFETAKEAFKVIEYFKKSIST